MLLALFYVDGKYHRDNSGELTDNLTTTILTLNYTLLLDIIWPISDR